MQKKSTNGIFAQEFKNMKRDSEFMAWHEMPSLLHGSFQQFNDVILKRCDEHMLLIC
jgi:hypothetical protein